MKVKELIWILNKLNPECEIYAEKVKDNGLTKLAEVNICPPTGHNIIEFIFKGI